MVARLHLVADPQGKESAAVATVGAGAGLASSRRRSTVLVDLDGGAAALLRVNEALLGVGDWLIAPAPAPDALRRLETTTVHGLRLVPPGNEVALSEHLEHAERLERLRLLFALFGNDERTVIVVAGFGGAAEAVLAVAPGGVNVVGMDPTQGESERVAAAIGRCRARGRLPGRVRRLERVLL